MSRSQGLTPVLLLLLLAGVRNARAGSRAGGRRGAIPPAQAPDPATTPEAVIQIYAARTVGWKGALGVHTWIALKRSGAPEYTRYEVIGWGVDRGASALRVNRTGPDNYWFGSRPDLLVDVRGDGVDALIDRVEAAVRAYPYPSSYRTWPGPEQQHVHRLRRRGPSPSCASISRRRRSARTSCRAARRSGSRRAAPGSRSRSSASPACWSAGRKGSRSTCSGSRSGSTGTARP